MTSSRPDWPAVRALFDRLGSLAPADQEAALADPALAASVVAEVRSLLGHAEPGEDFLAGAVPGPLAEAPSRAGERLGPWRLVAALGSGGMGEVWAAQRADGSFDGTAAVKVLKRGMDSQAVLARFALERQALARLGHPHIARLLDAGCTADGLPYFVMERVDGEPIDRACAGWSLERRLRCFLQLTDAVAHAHRQLLVHRDLKPSNVLVDGQGQVKLLDFGIAKALDPAGDHGETTQLGLRPFTPHFASPEQVRGEPVGTGTDIYSLGVLLYVVLTGTRPYGRDASTPQQAARAVLEEAPTRPSSLSPGLVADPQWLATRRRLAGDLDNILLKALDKRAEHRYASVDAFAADLRAHLDGRPVSARSPSWAYVAGKFVQRHQAPVVFGVLAVAALLGGFGATAWQAAEAARARDEARTRLAQTRDIARDIVARYADAITFLPGGLKLKGELLRDTLVHMDRLAEGADEDAAFAGELAMAYARLSDLQAGDADATLDDPEASARHAARALALFPRGEAAHREAPAFYMWWARAMRSMAYAARRQRELAQALQWRERERDLLLPVLTRLGDDPQLLGELGSAWIGIGQSHDTWRVASLNRPQQALQAFAEAEAVYRRLLARDPTDHVAWSQLGTVAGARMITASRLGDDTLAAAAGRQAVEHKRHALGLQPGHVSYRQGVAGEASNLVMVLLDGGWAEEALATARLSEATMAALMKDDPGTPTWRSRSRWFALHYGRADAAAGDHHQALRHYEATLAEMAPARAPAVVRRRAWARLEQARSLMALARHAAAGAALKSALADLDILPEAERGELDTWVLRAQVLHAQAWRQPQGRARTQALQAAREAAVEAERRGRPRPAQRRALETVLAAT